MKTFSFELLNKMKIASLCDGFWVVQMLNIAFIVPSLRTRQRRPMSSSQLVRPPCQPMMEGGMDLATVVLVSL